MHDLISPPLYNPEMVSKSLSHIELNTHLPTLQAVNEEKF